MLKTYWPPQTAVIVDCKVTQMLATTNCSNCWLSVKLHRCWPPQTAVHFPYSNNNHESTTTANTSQSSVGHRQTNKLSSYNLALSVCRCARCHTAVPSIQTSQYDMTVAASVLLISVSFTMATSWPKHVAAAVHVYSWCTSHGEPRGRAGGSNLDSSGSG